MGYSTKLHRFLQTVQVMIKENIEEVTYQEMSAELLKKTEAAIGIVKDGLKDSSFKN